MLYSLEKQHLPFEPFSLFAKSLSVGICNGDFDVILPQREAETKAKVQEKRCAKRLAVRCTSNNMLLCSYIAIKGLVWYSFSPRLLYTKQIDKLQGLM